MISNMGSDIPSVIPFIGYTSSPRSIILKLTQWNLCDVLFKRKLDMDEKTKVSWALEIATGILGLHTKKIIHRDLKTGKFLRFFFYLKKLY